MMRDGPPGSKRFLPPANLPEQWKGLGSRFGR